MPKFSGVKVPRKPDSRFAGGGRRGEKPVKTVSSHIHSLTNGASGRSSPDAPGTEKLT